MSPLLDELARRAAGDTRAASVPNDRGSLTRRAVVANGLLGAIALGGFGRLDVVGRARAASTKCATLKACLRRENAFWEHRLGTCLRAHSNAKGVVSFCMTDYEIAIQGAHVKCLQKCPRPKPKAGKHKSTPGGLPPNPYDPPPLPPNPYEEIISECANCSSAQVKGVCCWGGKDAGHLCVCANPEVDCRLYGC